MKTLSLGIDIGGTNSSFGLVDRDGHIYAETAISTSDYPRFGDYDRYVRDLAEAIKALLNTLDFDYEVVGGGIGAPNANMQLGTIEHPANLWKYERGSEEDESQRIFHLCSDLRGYLPEVPHFVITNDANAATIGEMKFGNARGMRDFAMITLGTGLGSGFVANGEMICGHDGFAGEMGHMTVVRGGRVCGCGKRGCLECYVSATGIKRTVFEVMANSRKLSLLRTIAYENFDSKMIYDAALNGDPIAIETFRYTGEILGVALANMATITSPEAIIIFGGLARAGALIFDPTKRYMEENIFPAYRGKIKILPSALQDKNIAILGAAALGMSNDDQPTEV